MCGVVRLPVRPFCPPAPKVPKVASRLCTATVVKREFAVAGRDCHATEEEGSLLAVGAVTGGTHQVAGESFLSPRAVDGVANGREGGDGAIGARVFERYRQCTVPCRAV